MLENQQYINASMMAENILDKYVKFPADDDLQHVIDGFLIILGDFLIVQEQWMVHISQ